MAEIRLGARARRDLIDIRRYGNERFGAAAADTYFLKLKQRSISSHGTRWQAADRSRAMAYDIRSIADTASSIVSMTRTC